MSGNTSKAFQHRHVREHEHMFVSGLERRATLPILLLPTHVHVWKRSRVRKTCLFSTNMHVFDMMFVNPGGNSLALKLNIYIYRETDNPPTTLPHSECGWIVGGGREDCARIVEKYGGTVLGLSEDCGTIGGWAKCGRIVEGLWENCERNSEDCGRIGAGFWDDCVRIVAHVARLCEDCGRIEENCGSVWRAMGGLWADCGGIV